MRVGSWVRALLLVLTMVVMASPVINAQTEIAATPEVQAPIETPVVEETPEIETPAPATTPEETQAPDLTAPDPLEVGDVTPESGSEDLPSATTPESTPQAQSRAAGDFEAMAADYTVIVNVTTSDGADVPAGTSVCMGNAIGDQCVAWTDSPLTFDLWGDGSNYSVSLPAGSGFTPIDGYVEVQAGEQVELDLVLQEWATVSVSLVAEGGASVPNGTEICLGSAYVWDCQIWNGTALTFVVDAGRVDYDVYPDSESGFAFIEGSFTVAAGETVSQTITVPVAATVSVTVVTADGGPLPENIDVYLDPSFEGWQYFDGDELTYTVSPGTVRYDVDLWGANDRYLEATGRITVAPGESTDLTIELQPAGPGTLRAYVSTEIGIPVPDGTEICVDMSEPEAGDPLENLCQVVSGDSVSFPSLDRGYATVTVTPPAGSGFEGGTWEYWVELGETTRVYVVLTTTEEAIDSTVAMTVRMSDDSPVPASDLQACLFVGELIDTLYLNPLCVWSSLDDLNDDGSVTLMFDVPAADYSYLVSAGNATNFVQGSVTAVSGETTPVEVVLPVAGDEVETATLVADVVTLDGQPVPEGTEVCAGFPEGSMEEWCQIWDGTTLTVEVPAGIVLMVAFPPDTSDYRPSINSYYRIVLPGETYSETITLYPYEFETGITMDVSDEAPQSGDTVTYTIQAYGSTPMFDLMADSDEAEVAFEITDVLPAELSDISVSCSGTYMPAVPSGTCYDLEGNTLTVFGNYWLTGVFDVTVTVTGTITGEPGTVVTNTAYVSNQQWGNEPTYLQLDESMIASTSLSGLAFQVMPDMPSASATLVIAGQVPVDPTPTPIDPTPTPVSTETPAPDPTETPAPVDPTETAEPEPTETPAPGTTPTATPDDPATPAAVTSLPNTGSGGMSTAPFAIFGGLAAALMLLGTGLVLRVRGNRS